MFGGSENRISPANITSCNVDFTFFYDNASFQVVIDNIKSPTWMIGRGN